VNTPTLLLVGEADWRTPPVEAIQFYTALQLRGVDSALVLVPGASHNVSARPSQHAAKTDNVIAWFQSHDRKDENPRAQ
jgi:acylaminoacyl-peptidase